MLGVTVCNSLMSFLYFVSAVSHVHTLCLMYRIFYVFFWTQEN